MSRATAALAAALLGLLLRGGVPPAAGQGWVAEVSAGSQRYEALAAGSGSRSATLGVRREGTRWLYLSGSAPLDSRALPWVAAGLGTRLSAPLRAAQGGMDLGAHAYGYRERVLDATGGGLTLAALPFLALPVGPARLEARSGVLHHLSSFADTTDSRTLHDSGVRAWLPLRGGVVLSGEGRLARAEEGSYPFLGAGAELPLGRASVWARAGRWLDGALDDPAWGVGVRARAGRGIDLHASFEEDPGDPLFWNGARGGWTVGASRALTPRPAATSPVPVTRPDEGGGVTLRLPLAEADDPPAVAGDFNGWRPVPMRRLDGEWRVTLDVPPGVYRYAFRRADGSWFVPEAVPNRVDDGFGGVNAVLVVTAASTR